MSQPGWRDVRTPSRTWRSQKARNRPFYAAAALLVFSMVCGFVAIAKIFKRAEGSEDPNDPAWSVGPVKRLLNGQSWTGMGAFAALFAGAVSLGLGAGLPKPSVALTIPGPTASPPAGGSLTIEGVWTELRFKTAAQQEIKLPQQTLPVTVTCQ